VTIKSNPLDHIFEIKGGKLTRSIRLETAGTPPRIGIHENSAEKAKMYLDFASDGKKVWIVDGDKELSNDEVSRLFAEDVLFPK
jgi:hypothetical protein